GASGLDLEPALANRAVVRRVVGERPHEKAAGAAQLAPGGAGQRDGHRPGLAAVEVEALHADGVLEVEADEQAAAARDLVGRAAEPHASALAQPAEVHAEIGGEV